MTRRHKPKPRNPMLEAFVDEIFRRGKFEIDMKEAGRSRRLLFDR
jgi:hypothetical protein